MSVALPAAVQGRRNCCVLTPHMEPPTSLEAEQQTPAEGKVSEAAPACCCFPLRLSQDSDPDSLSDRDSLEEFKRAEARASARDVKTAWAVQQLRAHV